MTEVKHTPGPWSVSAHEDYPRHIEAKDPFERGYLNLVGIAKAFQIQEGDSQHEHNMRLIAAAPDLLEAGNKVLNYATLDGILSDESRHADSVFAIRLGDLRELRAAIAKAEGRA